MTPKKQNHKPEDNATQKEVKKFQDTMNKIGEKYPKGSPQGEKLLSEKIEEWRTMIKKKTFKYAPKADYYDIYDEDFRELIDIYKQAVKRLKEELTGNSKSFVSNLTREKIDKIMGEFK